VNLILYVIKVNRVQIMTSI